jgi:hypothetical protein
MTTRRIADALPEHHAHSLRGQFDEQVVHAGESCRPDQHICCTADVDVTCACSIFEDEAVAELLTTGKLSELAVLTLYLM